MAILKRDDGAVFVLHPYRETLALKNSSLLRKEIHYLAETQGAYVRLFRQGQAYEAVFSQSAGFLLGESIWDYLEKPSDFIYCEVLPDEEKSFLLVVAREGKLYLDNQIAREQLDDELLPLLSENTGRYLVYLSDKVPADLFEGPAVKSINVLEQPLFSHIKINPAYQLLTLEQALAEYHLNVRKRSSLVLITLVCLLGLGGVWWWTLAHHQARTVQPQINPYEQYELALSTPAPGQQVSALLKGLTSIQSIAGWSVIAFDYKNNLATVAVQSLGGRATNLMSVAQNKGMTASFGSTGANITFVPIVNVRSVPDKIANVQHMVAIIIDRMMQILPGASVRVGKTEINNVFSKTTVTISFTNISPEILQLIGNNLNDFSISLISCTGQIHDGLLTGNLQLAVVGN